MHFEILLWKNVLILQIVWILVEIVFFVSNYSIII